MPKPRFACACAYTWAYARAYTWACARAYTWACARAYTWACAHTSTRIIWTDPAQKPGGFWSMITIYM